VRRAVLLLSLIVSLTVTAIGQYAVRTDTMIGFNGRFRTDRWTPVRVTLENFGQDISGSLEVSVVRGDRFGSSRTTIAYSRPLDLVSGVSKAFSFVLPLATAVYPIHVTVRDGEEEAHHEVYELLGSAVENTFAVVLARRPNLDFLLPVYNTREQRNLDIVYPLTSFLPDQWYGYDSVDVVVIHDARIQDLSTDQLVALRDWVAAGGRVVISGGSHFGPADAQTLSVFADLTATSIGTVELSQLGLREAGFPVDPKESDAQVVTTVFRSFGTKVTHVPIGRGDLVILPFDYAQLVRVAPMSSVGLWNSLLSPPDDGVHVSTLTRRRVFETEELANQLTLPLYSFPSRFLVLGLLLSYGIAVGAVLVWMSRRREPRTLLIGVPIVAAAILVTGLIAQVNLTDYQQPTEALALTIETVELTPDSVHGVLTQDMVLFSRQSMLYDARFDGSPLLVPLDNGDQRVLRDGSSTTLEIGVERWGNDNSVAVQLVHFPLIAHVRQGEGFVNVEVHNQTTRRIANLSLLSNGIPQEIGDVLPGAIAEVSAIPVIGDLAEVDWDSFVPGGPHRAHAAQLLSDIARAVRRDAAEGGPTFTLIGWLSQPLLNATLNPGFARDVRLSVVVIPVIQRSTERPTG
jgi:hypothetical protein